MAVQVEALVAVYCCVRFSASVICDGDTELAKALTQEKEISMASVSACSESRE